MAQSDAEHAVERVESEIAARTDRESVSTAMRYARRAAGSGALTGASGGVTLLRGLRALQRGDRRRGLARLLLGGLLVAAAAVQRRSAGGADVDQTDVADTSPDIEDIGTGSEDESDRHASGEEAAAVADTSPDIEEFDAETETETDRRASGEEAAAVVDTSPDIEDVGAETGEDEAETEAEGEPETGTEAEADRQAGDETAAVADAPADTQETVEEAETEERTYERLGEAAFDEHSREVPVPQRAFDLNRLTLGDEAFWGVREADDAVVVSGRYDPMQDGEAVRYVASSRVDEERMLQVPDAVTNHWDEVAGGGTAVAGGDGIVFATDDDLEDDGQMLVVPERWVDDLPGLGEGE